MDHDELVSLLLDHQWLGASRKGCLCGWKPNQHDTNKLEAHANHVANEIFKKGLSN